MVGRNNFFLSHKTWSFIVVLLFFKKIFLFIYLAALNLSCQCGIFSFGMWVLVPWPDIEPRSPALGTQNLSHWTTREVPITLFISFVTLDK